MKKQTKKAVIMLVAVWVMFSVFTAFSLRNTEKNIVTTENYSAYEINRAMNKVARHFNVRYLDCKLIQLYTTDKSDKNNGKITVFADFYVGNNVTLHPSMKSDEIYKRWGFELKNICGVWIITNHGYA